jgi:transposase
VPRLFGLIIRILFMTRNLHKTNCFIDSALERIKSASNVHDVRSCMSIVLVNQLGHTIPETGRVLGVSASTVSRLRREFQAVASGKPPARESWGGRRHALLSVEQEYTFLAPFIERAGEGELVIVAAIHEAFEQRVGKEVPASTVTRLLKRHRWRKVQPEPHHPDEDQAEQQAFKKNASPKS